MASDKVIDWLARCTESIPPFCVEIVLSDGARYFVHSAHRQASSEDSLVLRIYDLRALSAEDAEQVKKSSNEVNDRKLIALASLWKI